MRRLLTSIRDWLYLHSPARIPTLMEQSIPVWKFGLLEARIAELESSHAATVAVLDRFVSPRLASKEILRLLSHLPEEKALAVVKETVERLKAEGEL